VRDHKQWNGCLKNACSSRIGPVFREKSTHQLIQNFRIATPKRLAFDLYPRRSMHLFPPKTLLWTEDAESSGLAHRVADVKEPPSRHRHPLLAHRIYKKPVVPCRHNS
jgi:hypothetical protein